MECIAHIFDHFRGRWRCLENRGGGPKEQPPQRGSVSRNRRTQNCEGRFEKVFNRAALPQEFGHKAGCKVQAVTLTARRFERWYNYRLDRSRKDSAAQDDPVKGVFSTQALPNVPARSLDAAQIHLSIPLARRSDADK